VSGRGIPLTTGAAKPADRDANAGVGLILRIGELEERLLGLVGLEGHVRIRNHLRGLRILCNGFYLRERVQVYLDVVKQLRRDPGACHEDSLRHLE
jgi:hypothetical protein